MEYLQIAEEFARIVWKHKEKLEVKNLMLFGSVAYGKQNPSDIDLLVLHYSKILENFQDFAESKETKDLEKLAILSEMFNKENINLLKMFKETESLKLISENKFNLKYMNIKFFEEENYRNAWIEKDRKIHGHDTPRDRIHGITFEEEIFGQGLLWNPLTEKYDVPSNKKYSLKF